MVVCVVTLGWLIGLTGCTTKVSSGSGGGGSSSGGTTNQPKLVSLEATDGICPDNTGSFPPFNNTYNNTSTNSPAPVPNADPSCEVASEPLKILGNLQLHLRINTTNAAIDHYDWNIGPELRGGFDTNFTVGSPFFAQTFTNTITYTTPRMTELYALNDRDHGVFNVTISSTAFTGGGRFTAGFFNLSFNWPDATQVSASTGGAEISHTDPTHVADYYYIQADGAVTIVAVSETNAAGSVLTNIVQHLYNYNLQQTYVADSNASGFSRINADLSANADPLIPGSLSYYVEVEQPASAPYYLLLAADQTAANPATTVQKILQIPSPWNGRTYSGRVTEMDSFAQSPPVDPLSTNVPPPLIFQNDYCYTNADYYKVTSDAITTITATFTRPSYCPSFIPGCTVPTGAQSGIARVYIESLPGLPLPVSPLPNTQDMYALFPGEIYYVEVASLPTRTDQMAHPLGTEYTITLGSGTMVPTTSPFPPLAASPCPPPGP